MAKQIGALCKTCSKVNAVKTSFGTYKSQEQTSTPHPQKYGIPERCRIKVLLKMVYQHCTSLKTFQGVAHGLVIT